MTQTDPSTAATLVGPATTPPLPAGRVLRTVADAVVAKRHGDGSPLTISDLVAAYRKGIEDFATRVRRDLSALRAEAITAERKDAYNKALATVAALLGES